MLSSAEILAERSAGSLQIQPFSKIQMKGASYVLRLGSRFRRWLAGDVPVQLWSPDAAANALSTPEFAESLCIGPGDLVLGCTLESISLGSGLAGQISPLSHVARFGLGVTCGADFINPGFGSSVPSPLTLELFNHNVRPLELRAGMPLAHLRLFKVTRTKESAPLRSIYEGVDPLTSPLLHEEWSVTLRAADHEEP
jgi:dCTP deaminase